MIAAKVYFLSWGEEIGQVVPRGELAVDYKHDLYINYHRIYISRLAPDLIRQ